MSIRNSLGMDALTRNIAASSRSSTTRTSLTLSAFTALDLALMLVGLPYLDPEDHREEAEERLTIGTSIVSRDTELPIDSEL